MTALTACRQNNDLASDLHLAASRLSPKTEQSASESGCTDTRPTGTRSARAWDFVRLCHHLNSFCDFEDLSAAFIAVTEGKSVAIPLAGDHTHDEWHCSRCWAADELVEAVALWNRLFPKGWGTPLSRAEAEFSRRQKAVEKAQERLAFVAGSDAAWDAKRDLDTAQRARQWALRTLNDRF